LGLTVDAEPEIARVVRTLAGRPWLVAGRDDEDIRAVRRNLDAVRGTFQRLGWPLVVERDTVRLMKSPPERIEDLAAVGPTPLAASWFFLMVAAAESQPHQVAIGTLAEAAKALAAEAGVPVTNERHERRAIVQALRLLIDRGIVEATDGSVDAYVDSDDAPVLLTIFHTRLLYVIPNFDVGTDPAEEPEWWLGGVTRESDHAIRMRRKLIDDTCVHTADLGPEEADWLSRRLRDDGGPLAERFGLHIERRSEGAAFVVPDEAFRWPRELGPFPYPTTGWKPHFATLLADIVGAHGETSGGPGPGWRGMERFKVREHLNDIAARKRAGRGGMPADLLDDLDGMHRQVEELLTGVGLLRQIDGWWWISPVIGRWEPPPTSALTAVAEPATARPGDLFAAAEEEII